MQIASNMLFAVYLKNLYNVRYNKFLSHPHVHHTFLNKESVELLRNC